MKDYTQVERDNAAATIEDAANNLQEAINMAIAALREKAERARGCAYCVIGRRSPDAEYCSNCGRKLTPTLPELANESEEGNPDSHQYVDNDSTNRRKSVQAKKTATVLTTIQ